MRCIRAWRGKEYECHWSRLFALFAIALLALTTLATHLLHGPNVQLLPRRVVSRRCHRCELSMITIMVSLLH
jgi:hypothetical protein